MNLEKRIVFTPNEDIYWDNWGRIVRVFRKGITCEGVGYFDLNSKLQEVSAEPPHYKNVKDTVYEDEIEKWDFAPKTHHLKTELEFFEAINAGIKSFAIRKNDREFLVGDFIVKEEWDSENKGYTGRSKKGVIDYITDYGQPNNQVVLGITYF
ncbi:DUF3850 domain-containing protein [Listeria booriae]|uniref:DUF3850 domain-containing protein n=1 Tax=Listeria booriae TaxID=1552123 RepID=UPI001628CC71|nr:DUF3850 domain-containing protein [Listeria booriae]MBC2077660.1 DUF3850 domain-containing protein [Listeria booriae]